MELSDYRRVVISLDRRLVAVAVPLLLLTACPEPTPAPACGDLRSFDLSACNQGTLNQVLLGGVFNTGITWASGASSVSVINTVVQGAEKIDGRAATSKFVANGAFYFALATTEGGSQRRLAFAGCEGQSTFHVTGQAQSCVDGVKVDEGTFEAEWVDWGANEMTFQNVALVSETALQKGTASEVWVEGRWAYVAARTGGVVVFDVTAPATPLLTARVEETGDDWRDAKVFGNTLYVASQKHGVIFYDVTNPAAPARLGQVPADDVEVHSLELDPGTSRLFASSPAPTGEVLVFDISTPASPNLRYRAQATDVRGTSFFDSRMYVNQGAQGLKVFAMPPAPLGAIPASAAGVASESSQAASIGGRTVAFEGGEGWSGHVRALDFTDPLAPSVLGEWSNGRPHQSMHHMQLVGTKLYLAHYQSGLRILDVSDPGQPTQTGYYNTWRPFDVGRGNNFYDSAMGVRVPGDGNIYVAESARGLMIFGETGP